MISGFQVRIIFLPAIAVLVGLSIGYALYLFYLNSYGNLMAIGQGL